MEESGNGAQSCPHCGTSVGPTASYCPSCGDALPDGHGHFCRHCGAEFDRGDEFCSSCGASRYPDQAQQSGPSSTPAGPTHGSQSRHGQQHNTGGRSAPHNHGETADSTGEPTEDDYEAFQRRVNRHLDAGWELHRDHGDHVVLVDRDVGSLWIHALLLLFTYGMGNVFYALYRYAVSPQYKRLAVGDNHSGRRVPANEATAGQPSDTNRSDSVSKATSGTSASGANGAMYLVGGILMLWGLIMLSVGSVGTILVGSILTLLGAGVLPPVTKRLQRRRSVTEFGTVTSTQDKTVTDDPATCVVCGCQTEDGLRREYKKEQVVAGVPVRTVESGVNRYCPDCGLAHALDADEIDADADAEEYAALDDAGQRAAVDRDAIDEELDALLEEDASDTDAAVADTTWRVSTDEDSAEATGHSETDDGDADRAEKDEAENDETEEDEAEEDKATPERIESWEFGTER